MGTKDEKNTRKGVSICNILNNWSLEIHKSKLQDAASPGWLLVFCFALITNSGTVMEESDPSFLVTRNERWCDHFRKQCIPSLKNENTES